LSWVDKIKLIHNFDGHVMIEINCY